MGCVGRWLLPGGILNPSSAHILPFTGRSLCTNARVPPWQMERRSEHAILDELRDRFFAAGLPPFSTADLRSKLAAAGGDIDAALRQAGVTVPAKRAPAPAPAASLLPARVERSDAPATKMTEPPRVELTISPSPARAPPSNSSARAAPAVVAKGPPKELSFIGGSIDMFRANKLYVLLALVPVSAASEHLGFSHGAIFALACVAILPLAALLGDATEQLALHTNETIGGLLNATFGNATELIICYFLLKSGQLATVQISLLGSILSNSLLVMGFACMAAGMVKREVCFSDQAAGHNTTMLLIAILGISLPTLMVNIGQFNIHDEPPTLTPALALALALALTLNLTRSTSGSSASTTRRTSPCHTSSRSCSSSSTASTSSSP